MKISLFKILKLIPVFLIINTLWFIERFSKHIIRATVILVVVLSVLVGPEFDIKISSKAKSIQNLPLLFVDSPEVLGTQVVSYPIFVNISKFPDVTAKAIFVSELDASKVLVDINGEQKFAPASTTKLMTAIVALDIYETSDYLQIPEFCTQVEGQKSGFEAGDIYSVGELLKGLLINSSADAACTLSISKVNYPTFVGLMNDKAREIGMTSTNFTNPIGLDGENGGHFSTAYDLYKLSQKAANEPIINKLVQTKSAFIENTDGKETYIWNTNDLLWGIPGSVGVKTGTTEEAGEVLIYRYKTLGKDILIIVMGSTDRFDDTIRVLNWTIANHRWEN